MKEVKIYMIVSDQLLLLIIGELFCIDMVCYSDYVEFEVKYVVLVVDNDKVMELFRQVNVVVKLVYEKFLVLVVENEMLKY